MATKFEHGWRKCGGERSNQRTHVWVWVCVCVQGPSQDGKTDADCCLNQYTSETAPKGRGRANLTNEKGRVGWRLTAMDQSTPDAVSSVLQLQKGKRGGGAAVCCWCWRFKTPRFILTFIHTSSHSNKPADVYNWAQHLCDARNPHLEILRTCTPAHAPLLCRSL